MTTFFDGQAKVPILAELRSMPSHAGGSIRQAEPLFLRAALMADIFTACWVTSKTHQEKYVLGRYPPEAGVGVGHGKSADVPFARRVLWDPGRKGSCRARLGRFQQNPAS